MPPASDALAETDQASAPRDRAAWERLIVKHQRRVLVALMGEGLSMDDARDVAQDAWARLWNQFHAGALTSLQMPGVAITQARFLARDLRRRRRTVQYEPETADVEANHASVESVLVSAETLGQVQRELALLSASHQQVFRLATDEGVPHADIAARVGLSTQRVRQIVWEVRVRLRALMETP